MKAEEWAKIDMFRNLKYRPETIAGVIREIQADAVANAAPPSRTEIQEREQCDGPHRPPAEKLGLLLLRQIPSHYEVRAISIRGQGGGITVECYHEGAPIIYRFNGEGNPK